MKKRAGKRAKPSRPPPALRGRVWVDVGPETALTEAGADLLEQIDAWGSLSEAARRLRFSYRRAWLLVSAMNRRWAGPLVSTATGGKRGGGAGLTELGRAVLHAYRDVQVQVEYTLGQAAGTFRRAVGATQPPRHGGRGEQTRRRRKPGRA